MAYGKKYYMSFERTFINPKGVDMVKNYQFNIYFQGYTGVPIELPCMGDSPVVLRYDGDKDNIFEPIVKGSMEFELVNVTGFVFDDMIEAGDADCWCELVELTGDIVIETTSYRYNEGGFFNIQQNPTGSSPFLYQEGFYITFDNIESVYLMDSQSTPMQINFDPNSSFPIQKEQVFNQLIGLFNSRYNSHGITFINNGNLDVDITSTVQKTIGWAPSSAFKNEETRNMALYPDAPTYPDGIPITTTTSSKEKLIFSGFLSPAGIVRPYTNSPSTMKFVASDGLNMLNNIAYGSSPSDLLDVSLLDVILKSMRFRNNITNTAIQDDLYIEWDFSTMQQGSVGGSECSWIMQKISGVDEVLRVSYDITMRIYRTDGINYDTYVFKNKGENDKLYLNQGEYQYNQDGSRDWMAYDDARMIDEASTLLSICIQEKLTSLNVNSSYLVDQNSKTIGVKSSSKIHIDRIIYDGKQLVLTNTYSTPSVSPLVLSSLTIEGYLFAGKSVSELIGGMLKSFGWRMYYYGGWKIERVLNIGKQNRSFSKYTGIGSDAVQFPVASTKDEGSDFFIESGASETRINSWRDVTFKQPYGKKDSLIYNKITSKDFNYNSELRSYMYKFAVGNAYCMKDKSGKNLLVGTKNNTFDYCIMKGYGNPNKLTVKYVAVNPTQSVSVRLKIGSQWMDENGAFHDAVQTITKSTPTYGDVSFEINFSLLAAGQIELHLSNQTSAGGGGGSDALVSEFSLSAYYLKESSIGYELQLNINQFNRNKTKEVDFLVGSVLDVPQYASYYTGLLKQGGQHVLSMSDGLNTGRLADIIGNEYAYVYAKNRMCINGTITRNVEPTDALKFANGKILTFASIGSFDIKRNRLEGEFVEVVSQSYILRIEPLLPINIAPLDTPTLPATVVATFSDGTAQTIPVTWEKFTQTNPGTYIAKGYVGVNMANVEQTVIIEPIASYTPLSSVTVEQNQLAILPTTAHCTTTGGLVRDYAITWTDKDTSVIGTRIIKGIVAYGFEVALTMIVTPMLTDLDILRQIRDANPTSQLPSLWSEAKDPYTQWGGVVWSLQRVVALDVVNMQIGNIQNINKLSKLEQLIVAYNPITSVDILSLSNLVEFNASHCLLTYLDVSNMALLENVDCQNNSLEAINILSTPKLSYLWIPNNKIASIPSLTAKGLITAADFTHNKMPATETDRLIAMGFTPAQVLPQDLP